MARWSRYNTLVDADSGSALLFNARTGALIRVSSERRREIETPAVLSGDFLEFLLQQGFVIGDEVDEVDLIVRGHEQARNDPLLFSATIELTEACNFRCIYCYQDHVPKHLDDRTAQKVVHYLCRQMAGIHQLHVNWFGGEPLLRLATMAFMSQALAHEAQTHGCLFTQFLTTNGYLLTRPIATQLAGLGISNIQITLDGDQASHDQLRVLASGKGTYREVLAACENVVSAGIDLMVRINLTRWNTRQIDGLLADLVSRGISPANTVIHTVRAIDHGNCDPAVSSMMFTNAEFAGEWIRILEIIGKYGFGLPTLAPRPYNCAFDLAQTVMIGRDATIRHCSSSTGCLAQLTDSGEETRRTVLYDRVKSRTPFADADCRECSYLPMCMGGCSYLQELGQEKCNPERYVLPELVRLTACQAQSRKGEKQNGKR